MSDNTEPQRAPGRPLMEENLEELYEQAPCGYISTWPDGSFARVNATFLRWTGYQRDALLGGMRFQDLLTVGGKVFYETHYVPLLYMQGAVTEIAFDLVCREGQLLPVVVNTVQHRDATGIPVANRATIFNASQRRAYERELQQARAKAENALRLRDQFLSLAAHELNTPLFALLGHVELLHDGLTGQNSLDARDQRSLQIILDQTRRLSMLVRSLLDLSRIETGQLAIERAPVDVSALVGRVVEEAQLLLQRRQIEVQRPREAVMVDGDALRLEQVFHNLVQNSVKYSAAGTPVRVTLSQQAGTVCVAVSDRGIGIPAAALPRLFERYYRAANVAESSARGMGIGLSVVKEIVELHGGRVLVESTEGTGSTFTVCLPVERR